MAVVMEDSSTNRAEVMLKFPTSGTKRGARVVAHIVFSTCLTALERLLMSGGRRTEFSESIFTGSAVVTVSRRESVLISTSSLVPMDVLEEPLMKVSLSLLESTVGHE